jgi:hypothetical protein
VCRPRRCGQRLGDAAGAAAVRRDGGTLIAVGDSTSVGARFRLGVTNFARELSSAQYFVPGSVLRVSVDNTTPLGYGFEPEVDVFFDNSPVFRLDPKAAGAQRVAWFPTATPLRSGWAWGQQHLRDGVTVVDAPLGQGRVLLFGPQITFRAQSHWTFKFLFNGILYPKAEPVRLE